MNNKEHLSILVRKYYADTVARTDQLEALCSRILAHEARKEVSECRQLSSWRTSTSPNYGRGC